MKTVYSGPNLIFPPQCGQWKAIHRKKNMTVKELIEYLEDCDQNANVLLAYQPRWPICVRAECLAVIDNMVNIGMSASGGNDYLPK